MANPITHFLLTPQQAQEKALKVEQMRANPRGPWVNGKLTRLPKQKRTTLGNKKKDYHVIQHRTGTAKISQEHRP